MMLLSAANPQLTMFGGNIFLLIGLLLMSGIVIFLLIASWTTIKVYLFRKSQRRAEAKYRSERFAPDGTPLPPVRRGICERCNQVRDRVYFLPTGERLCREHLDERQATQTDGAAALGES